MEQLDPETGDLVHTWTSAAAAARALGLKTSAGISVAAKPTPGNDATRVVGGFRWRLVGEPPAAITAAPAPREGL